MASRALQLTATAFSVALLFASGTASLEETFASSPLQPPQHLHDDSLSPTSLFEPILAHLGFHDLATVAPSLADSPSFATWHGPSTIFAPTDASIRTCSSCSVSRLLSEHVVPGLFSFGYLRSLPFGTKIETMSPGHCLTITSAADPADNGTRVFVNGVEITHPEMFNNGLMVVHRLHGFISPLSPFSCSIEKMTPLAFPAQSNAGALPSPVMRLMLRDAMLRLRTSGFGILSLALKIKYRDLVPLHNATIFAIDDSSIFGGLHSYVSNVRFHIVPNHYLATADLEQLPAGTILPTLDGGRYLVVTTPGGTPTLRINYVRIKFPEVMKNPKVVVHALFLPFPHLHPATMSGLVNGNIEVDHTAVPNETLSPNQSCNAHDEHGNCGVVVPPPEYHHQGL